MSAPQRVAPDLATEVGRLLHLRDILVRVAAEGRRYNHREFFSRCGTPSCALGHYAADPDARAAGWRSEVFYGSLSPVLLSADGDVLPLHLSPMEAADRWFGEGVYRRVFGDNSYPWPTSAVTVETVIARVDEVLAERGVAG